uniref:22.8 kDa protein n=1 Tax=Ipomoea trifida TaxID=35884 RepID=Q40097_IPOTF|nr:22.8 kDa protein [Ipomoea trifida]
MATALYKLVAERGPWSSLSRWALESYLKGDVGKAFLLYSRMAELGYEVAQSNAAWILDKYGPRSMCMGGSGICTDAERHQRSHALWWPSSEQGNEHAALLIGDAYYYGRGTERDYKPLRHDYHYSLCYKMGLKGKVLGQVEIKFSMEMFSMKSLEKDHIMCPPCAQLFSELKANGELWALSSSGKLAMMGRPKPWRMLFRP